MDNNIPKVILGKDSKIIGQNDDFYLVTNTPNTALNDLFNYAVVVDKDGKQITTSLPIGSLTKDEQWNPVDIPYTQLFKPNKINTEDALLGFAVGDAFGVPVEFLPREIVKQINLTEMVGKDTHLPFQSRWGQLIPSGAWSDDTSMLISSMDSIVSNNGEINYEDIMNKFLDWINTGKYTSIDTPFGLGGIVMKSLNNYCNGVPPLECGEKGIRDNGNGALMRILPFSLYCINAGMSEAETAEFISKASGLTHGHDISKMSCFIYTEYLRNIIETKNPALSLDNVQGINYNSYFSEEAIAAHRQLLKRNFKFINEDKIKASGYVVDTLESVIYSILNAEDYETSIETATNMGYDTDTVAGITGSIAGILYGKENIPERWLSKLRKKDYLSKLANEYDKTLESIKSRNNNLTI